MEAFKEMVGLAPKKELGFWGELDAEMTLSYKKRLIGFGICVSLGVLFCVMSTWFLISPVTFGKFYTIGSILILCSTFFLVGPVNQLKSMFHPSRAWASIIYILAIIATLYTALHLQKTGPTLILIIVQFGAAVWYAFSYIPFCHTILRSSGSSLLPS